MPASAAQQRLVDALAETEKACLEAGMPQEGWDDLRPAFAKFVEPEHANDGDHETDAYGRVHLERVPITKAMVCPYKGSEIPGFQDLGLEPERIYQLLRDPDEIAKAASSSNGVQLLIKHTPVSAEDHKPYEVAGAIGTSSEFEKPYLYNDVTIWTRYAIDGVDDDSRRELSSSYGYRPDMTPGTFDGDSYDGIMRDLKFNHVALVVAGRCGPTVAIDEDVASAEGWHALEQALLRFLKVA